MNSEYAYRKDKIKKHSHSFVKNLQTDLAVLTIESHVIEKGITMPERRLGFGYSNVRDVIKRCNEVIQVYGCSHTEIQACLADLRQYVDIHNQEGYELPKDITNGISHLLQYEISPAENCYKEYSYSYFKSGIDFPSFAHSRHSIRSFDEKHVDNGLIEAAIELAQTAPSACNRQATRVKIVESEEKKSFLISLQRGNRGFGDKADKWLIVTSELACWPHLNISDPYLDAGIFTMNLLYALHYYKIAACTLNANLTPSEKERLQETIGFPASEIPIVFIAIGYPQEEFMIAKSRRLKPSEIITYY